MVAGLPSAPKFQSLPCGQGAAQHRQVHLHPQAVLVAMGAVVPGIPGVWRLLITMNAKATVHPNRTKAQQGKYPKSRRESSSDVRMLPSGKESLSLPYNEPWLWALTGNLGISRNHVARRSFGDCLIFQVQSRAAEVMQIA